MFVSTTEARRDRGQLHREVMEICNEYVADPNGYLESPHLLLTTHRIAQLIEQNTGKKVTNSAVQRVLKRWEEIGFAILASKPVAFLDYTDAAVELGMTALEETFKNEIKNARRTVIERNREAAQRQAIPSADDPVAATPRSFPAATSATPYPVDEDGYEPVGGDEGLEVDLSEPVPYPTVPWTDLDASDPIGDEQALIRALWEAGPLPPRDEIRRIEY